MEIKWIYHLILPGILFFLTGIFLVRSLSVHPVKMYVQVFVFSVLLTFGTGMVGYLAITEIVCIPVISGFLFFLAGYWLQTRIIHSRRDHRYIPEISRSSGDSGDHIAVVYFTHGEPETYDPVGWINQFRELDEQKIPFIPFLIRPLFLHLLRKKYLETGRSNHRSVHLRMLEKVEQEAKKQGRGDLRFYPSFLDDDPRPDASVIQALNNGASSIVVATVFLTISNHTDECRKIIQKIDCQGRFGVEVIFTPPLWDSDTLAQSFVDKVNRHLGDTPKEEVAIALVGYGQPAKWDREFPTMTRQQDQFRDNIANMLVKEGFRKENIGKAWMEFKSPRPADLMKTFVANGAKKILYFASAISADAIHSQSDLPALINRFPFPEGVETVNLGAWNDHPLVIRAIWERIEEAINVLKIQTQPENYGQ